MTPKIGAHRLSRVLTIGMDERGKHAANGIDLILGNQTDPV